MKEYTFKFRHIVEVEVKVTRPRKLDAEDRAERAMEVYGEDFLTEDEDEIYEAGTKVWLGGKEGGTCATVIQRTGWERVKP